jgi:hypothetical protein
MSTNFQPRTFVLCMTRDWVFMTWDHEGRRPFRIPMQKIKRRQTWTTTTIIQALLPHPRPGTWGCRVFSTVRLMIWTKSEVNFNISCMPTLQYRTLSMATNDLRTACVQRVHPVHPSRAPLVLWGGAGCSYSPATSSVTDMLPSSVPPIYSNIQLLCWEYTPTFQTSALPTALSTESQRSDQSSGHLPFKDVRVDSVWRGSAKISRLRSMQFLIENDVTTCNRPRRF